MKRAFDFLVSLLLLIVLFPILVIISIIIAFDGGNIIYRQKRVGINGKEFDIYKFRSMVKNADKIGGFSTQSSDPRITKIGAILRRTSLDELPQLLNVLLGQMSFVGPRPNVPAQYSQYSPVDWNKRNTVKPGITGLAQAKLRSLATFDQRLQLDLEYVDTQSFFLDIKILVLTATSLFSNKGN
ncbi:sugar transferase [Escherichia coli]|uniref:sugar transferase n=1 Tax=Escherichia coli TaxID=562 RepID=UPI000DEF10CB|nr:sugar transferase [Escherichia coli]EEW7548988.1 sugar transferase [Escherichia coli]EFB9665019.1 sugar transferase [Escherichia coli]EGN4481242.1 sugar transferase [Escherichia coli]EIP9500799.1 sugar transferase [Escherichia coli]EKG4611084.1 sugar transferase [Escherichia coli]